METAIKQVVEIPKDTLDQLILKQDRILTKIEHLEANEPLGKEWLTPREYMEVIGIKRTKFESLKPQLKLRKIGKKVYVYKSDVDRYFNGELK